MTHAEFMERMKNTERETFLDAMAYLPGFKRSKICGRLAHWLTSKPCLEALACRGSVLANDTIVCVSSACRSRRFAPSAAGFWQLSAASGEACSAGTRQASLAAMSALQLQLICFGLCSAELCVSAAVHATELLRISGTLPSAGDARPVALVIS